MRRKAGSTATERLRCPWAKSDQYIEYHDKEWGVPVHDDRSLFEFLILEGMQAGLSWETILRKRENFRSAFDHFDPAIVAKYGKRKQQSLLADAGIIRNRLKIEAAIQNARAFLAIQQEFGTFHEYIWGFVDHKTKQNAWRFDHGGACPHTAVRRNQQGLETARVYLRGQYHLLRLHAGGGNGQRPSGGMLSIPAA